MPRTIRIVDDCRMKRYVLQKVLKDEYDPIEAVSGEEVLETLHKVF